MSTFLMEYLRGCWVNIYNILRIKSHKINSQHCPFYHNCVTNNARSLLPEHRCTLLIQYFIRLHYIPDVAIHIFATTENGSIHNIS